jgi:hypothetical protein
VTFNPATLELMKDARLGGDSAWRFGLVVLGISGGFVGYSGVSFRKLRAWSRTSLEMVSWLALVACIGIGVYLISLFIGQPEVFFAGCGAPIGPVLLATANRSHAHRSGPADLTLVLRAGSGKPNSGV